MDANKDQQLDAQVETAANFFITIYSLAGGLFPIGWYYMLRSSDRLYDFSWASAIFIEIICIPLFFLCAPYSGIFAETKGENETK